ncbi:MAG: ABC transporter permease, partial [archaeon]|nr:ABC transporter permease [archaeon]
LSAVIIIPKDFSDSIESLWNDIYADGEANDTASWTNVTLSIYLDEGSIFAQMVIIPLVQQTLIETIYGQTNSIELPVEINDGSIESEDKSQFDFMMPGLYAFAIMFLTMTIAQSIVEEREKGILTRMNTTPTSSTEFISSHTTANVVVAAVQVIIVHLVATVMGFNPNVGLDGLAIGFLISIIYSVSVVGFGLITVSMSKSSGAATGLSFLFIIPQLMLGGFIPNIPEVVGRLMPNYYVTDALTSLFLRGASVNSPTILYDLLMVSIYSIVVFVISIIIYQKFGKKQ